jgi:hypothetical protein
MLFDLQSRRRRTAVKIIYLLLAVLMAGGLILFGVGAGNGNGGFLNSLTGNGSGGNSVQNSAADAALKTAEKKVRANPKSAAAWEALTQARYEAAESGKNYNSTSDTFTASGKAELTQVLAAWEKYSSLVKGKPDESTVVLAARVYALTGDFSEATVAWQEFISGTPTDIKGYDCLALTAYAAKKSTLGDQAAAKAESLTPKLQRVTLKQAFTSAKSSPSTAKEAVSEEC